MRQGFHFPKWAARSERRITKPRQNTIGHSVHHCRLLCETLEDRHLLSINPIASFAGFSDTGWMPPAPTAAVGPTELVAAVNSHVGIFAKTGTMTDSANLDTTWSGKNGFFESVDHEFDALNPAATYDRYSDRFLVIAEEVEHGTANSDGTGGDVRGGYGADEAYVMLGVSTSNAPKDLAVTPGDTDKDWNFYSILATHDFGTGLAWINSPKIAADAGSLYITGDYYTFGARRLREA